MRTLKFTDEQISMLKQAIGIAENRFSKIHKEIVETTIRVRNMENEVEHAPIVLFYHKQACIFADLNIALENGDFDV
jgi:hypothetical protein